MRFARLPRMITGFQQGRAPRRSVEPAAFTRACHGVAAIAGGTVSLVRPDRTACNFVAARITTRTESLTVLGHRVYPLVAFLADLADAELQQIAYHEPERIGAIVFNDWD